MNHRGTETTEKNTENILDLAESAVKKHKTTEGGSPNFFEKLCASSVPSVSLW
jgi:hypothetical protein